MIREMKSILKITGGRWQFALLLLLRCPFGIAWTLIQASFLRCAFDAVAQGDAPGLTAACLRFGVASLCLFLYNGAVWSVYAAFVSRMEGRLRALLYGKIASLPCERIESVSRGEWLTRLNADVEMPFSRPFHLPHAACAVVNICASALLLWRVNPAVLGWVALFVAPHVAANQLLTARAMPRLQRNALEASAKSTAALDALITCADIAALYDGWDYLLRRFEESSLALCRANMKMHCRCALSAGILPLFGLGGYLALLLAAGGWIASGSLTFGGLTAAFQYRSGILAGALMLIRSMISIQASMAGIRRLNETMGESAAA